MKFVIKPVMTQHRTNLSHAQRTNPLFSEAPVVLGRTLRRGQSMTIDEEQMAANSTHLERLYKAGSITVEPLLSEEEKQRRFEKMTIPSDSTTEQGVQPQEQGDAPVVQQEEVPPQVTEEKKEEAAVVEALDSAGKEGSTTEIVESTPVPVEDAVVVKTGKKGKKG